MAGDLNAKHMDWNSRLTTAKGLFLRGYANRNTCVTYGLDYPTTAPYTHNDPPEELDKVVVKNFVHPLHLTVSSAPSSDQPHVLIDITCLSSYQNLQDRPDFQRMDCATIQACFKDTPRESQGKR
jgi:hypothetical protein